tara:strand:+ start:212 stop:553 length:342 start_codon:yes stop_codon:yes gene_type:complete
MKAFAEKATLMADGDGIKLYEVVWYDGHGKKHLDMARGHNMKSALDTILKQKKADRIKSVPEWAWILLYMSATGAFSFSVVYGGFNFVSVTIGAAALAAVGYTFIQKYFRYTE